MSLGRHRFYCGGRDLNSRLRAYETRTLTKLSYTHIYSYIIVREQRMLYKYYAQDSIEH